jgi:drug/metabolite transporter (DMT)-like permease
MYNYSAIKYYIPVAMVVGSNIVYQICAKSIPKQLNPMISIVITYLIGATLALVLFFLIEPSRDVVSQLKMLNFAPFVLGFSVVGLEAGFIFLYRAGWNISVGSLVCNILLAIFLIAVGYFLYKEHISAQQVLGIALCIAGLIFINK